MGKQNVHRRVHLRYIFDESREDHGVQQIQLFRQPLQPHSTRSISRKQQSRSGKVRAYLGHRAQHRFLPFFRQQVPYTTEQVFVDGHAPALTRSLTGFWCDRRRNFHSFIHYFDFVSGNPGCYNAGRNEIRNRQNALRSQITVARDRVVWQRVRHAP